MARREITDLTICRAVFAAWVFAYHVNLHAHFAGALGCGWVIRRGYLGVDGFFLLSGFILAWVHPELGQSSVGAYRFWVKRLARIYPVHLAVLLLLAAVALCGFAVGVVPRDPGRFTLPSFLANLLLIQGWGAGRLAWNYPSWSVSTEWAGYLLFPAFWLGIARLPAQAAAVLLCLCLPVLALVDMASLHGLNLTFATSLLRFFPEFGAGILTARLLPLFRMPGALLAVSGVVLTLAALGFAGDVMVVAGLWAALAGLARQAASGRAPLFRDFAPLRFLGVLSYSFYMSFGTVELFLAQLYRHLGWDPAGQKLAYAAAMTGLTFLLALSLHHLVEIPARARIDRRFAPLETGRIRL